MPHFQLDLFCDTTFTSQENLVRLRSEVQYNICINKDIELKEWNNDTKRNNTIT